VWAKANKPGPFTGGTMKFNDWDEKFTIYLDGLPGITGIQLSYVICDKSPGTYIEDNYIQMIAALAPHKGPVFQADAHTVHGYLRGFISGQQATYWSTNVIEKANGWSDMLALRAHYRGSGNLTAIIAEAQRLYNTLSSRSEKSKGSFEKFLTETKRMFKMFANKMVSR
jgi:hypothetical protein